MLNAKNLLIAAAIGLPASAIKNFIVSFRKVNTKDKFIVLVDEQTKRDSYEVFLNNFVEVIVCDAKKYNTSPINSRHLFYYDLIQQLPEYKNVLVSDTRDLLFQSDPFSYCPDEPHLFAFEEDSNCPLMHEINNRNWIRTIYGEKRLEQIGNNPILCGGAMLGSRKEMLKLLYLMAKEMLNIDPNVFSWTVADQPVLNHICYSELAKDLNLSIKKNGDVMVNLCVSLVHNHDSDQINLDIKTNLISVNGKVPSIIHQYDRSETLVELYDRIYKFR